MNTHKLPLIMTSTFKHATEENAVRVCEFEKGNVALIPYIWPERGSANETHIRRDKALAEALSFHDAEWPDTNPGNTTRYYTDAHGTWCVECGYSCISHEDGGQVCINPTCAYYRAQVDLDKMLDCLLQ